MSATEMQQFSKEMSCQSHVASLWHVSHTDYHALLARYVDIFEKGNKEIALNMTSNHVYILVPLSFGKSEFLYPLECDNSTRYLIILQAPWQWYDRVSWELR